MTLSIFNVEREYLIRVSLGFCGALVNGFTQSEQADSISFYDMPQYRDFWATVEQLNVPFYLHPRSPLLAHQPAYQGTLG
jgi:gamma-resorcylate decarboxylase